MSKHVLQDFALSNLFVCTVMHNNKTRKYLFIVLEPNDFRKFLVSKPNKGTGYFDVQYILLDNKYIESLTQQNTHLTIGLNVSYSLFDFADIYFVVKMNLFTYTGLAIDSVYIGVQEFDIYQAISFSIRYKKITKAYLCQYCLSPILQWTYEAIDDSGTGRTYILAQGYEPSNLFGKIEMDNRHRDIKYKKFTVVCLNCRLKQTIGPTSLLRVDMVNSIDDTLSNLA